MDRRNCDVEFYVDDQSAEFNSGCFLYIQDSNIGRINIYNLPDGIIYNKDGEKSPNNFYYTVSFEVINFDGEISEVRGSLFVMKTDGKQVEFLLSENGKVYVRKLESETVGDFIESQKEIYDALKDMQSAVIDVKVNDLSVVVDGVANIPMDTYLAGLFKNVSYTAETGILTFTKHDNSTLEIDLPLEEIVEGGYYDSETNELVLVLANEEEIRIPVGELLSGIATEEYVDTKITNLDLNNRFNDKVDKVENSRLMTDLEGTKLANIEEYAEVNVLKTVKVDNVVQTITDKSINIDLSGKVDKTTTGNTRRVYGVNALNEQELTDIEATPTNESIKLVTSGGIYSALDGKVDKVEGYGLSKNDYTDTDVEKVGKIEIDGDGDKALLNDGSYGEVGKVDTVNDIGPDENKNIEITGEDIHLKDITTKTLTKGIEDIEDNIGDIEFTLNTLAGLGGDLAAYNFGGATPTQQQLNDYALSQISSITDPNDIFNNTRVKNLFDGNVWRLTNTPNTEPPVFEWINVGSDMIAPATDLTYGSVKGNDNISFTNGLPTVLKSADADKLGGELPGHYAKASDVVDKITTGNIRRVYGVNASNEQEAVEIETSPVQSSTKLLTSGGVHSAISGLDLGDKNILEEIKVDNVVQTITDKSINIDLSGKVDKTTTGNTRRVYGVNDLNEQELTDIEATPTNESIKLVTSGGIYSALDGKVDKVEGYGLSKNDYTDTDVEKVGKIEIDGDGKKALLNDGTYGEVGTVDTVNNVLPDENKNITITADDISDTSTTNKFATAEQLTQIATNAEDIEDLQDDKVDKVYSTDYAYTDGLVFSWKSDTNTYRVGDGTSTNGNGFTGTATEIVIPKYYDDGTNGIKLVDEIGQTAFSSRASITSIKIPSSVTSIGINAFNGCTNLTSIIIPDSVTRIGSYAFYSCTSLTSITIPKSVTSIGIYAFYRCIGLTEITIPSSVTSIGVNAFSDCTSLKSFTCLSTTPPTLVNTNAISTATTVIYVPYSSLTAYKTATNWLTYADRIFAIPEGKWIKDSIDTNTNNINALETNKADKATTISGYGITDAYTKTEIESKIASCATTQSYTATLPYTSWTGTSAPYSKEITVSGILATDKPDFDLNLSSASYSNIPTIQSAWFNVYRTVASANKITFYSHEIPSIDIPLLIKVVR